MSVKEAVEVVSARAFEAFFVARIDEREQAAHAAIQPDEMHPWGNRSLPQLSVEQIPDEVRGHLGGTWGEHFALWDPMRVIDECKVRRLVLRRHARLKLSRGLMCHQCWERDEAQPWPCNTLRYLALPDAYHPDFDEAWLPTWPS